MKIKLFEYNNEEREFELKDKLIEHLLVNICTGDEIVTVFYEDGDIDYFDSGECRLANYNDGSYIVSGEFIRFWMNFDASEVDPGRTLSYARQEIFG